MAGGHGALNVAPGHIAKKRIAVSRIITKKDSNGLGNPVDGRRYLEGELAVDISESALALSKPS